jgi:hypothetical protein
MADAAKQPAAARIAADASASILCAPCAKRARHSRFCAPAIFFGRAAWNASTCDLAVRFSPQWLAAFPQR